MLLLHILRELSHNLISSIADGAFTGLSSLQYLYVVLTVHTFATTSSSNALSRCNRVLPNNFISSIAKDSFTGLDNLVLL
jgi:hypothetical protein